MVTAKAVGVNETAVFLDNGEVLPYDYLVLAPGSSYPDATIKSLTGSLASRTAFLKVNISMVT